MTCYQAYQTLAYDYNQTLGYSVSTFRRAKDSLEKRLANAPSVIEKTTKATTALQEALRNSKVRSKLDVTPDEANEQIAAYRKITTDAQARIPTLQAEVDDIVEQAKVLMAEGKPIVQRVQSSVVCR